MSRSAVDYDLETFSLSLVPLDTTLPPLASALVKFKSMTGPAGEFSLSQVPYEQVSGPLGDIDAIMSAVVHVKWSANIALTVTMTFALDRAPEDSFCMWNLDTQQCVGAVSSPRGAAANISFDTTDMGRFVVRRQFTAPTATAVQFGVAGAAAIIALGIAVAILIGLLMWISLRFHTHRKKTAKELREVRDRSKRPTAADRMDKRLDKALYSADYTPLPAYSPLFLQESFPNRYIPAEDIKLGPRIGKGSYSTVRQGKWGDREVAVKVADRASSSDLVSNIRQEARVLIDLAPHPNIIHVLGVAEDKRHSYLVMEFCQLGSVEQLHRAHKLKVDDISKQYKIMLAVAKALAHLHSFRIVHRDVAARNILVTDDWDVRLSDFGMSKQLAKGQVYGTFKSKHGPVRWMAPECFKHRQFSPASDVWAFANTVCEILSGLEPFVGLDPADVAVAVRDHATSPQVPPNCPHWLKKTLQKCWSMDPAERPTMRRLVDKLGSAILPPRTKHKKSSKRKQKESPAQLSAESLALDYGTDGDEISPPAHVSVLNLNHAFVPHHDLPPGRPANNVLDSPLSVASVSQPHQPQSQPQQLPQHQHQPEPAVGPLVDTSTHEDAMEDDM